MFFTKYISLGKVSNVNACLDCTFGGFGTTSPTPVRNDFPSRKSKSIHRSDPANFGNKIEDIRRCVKILHGEKTVVAKRKVKKGRSDRRGYNYQPPEDWKWGIVQRLKGPEVYRIHL